MTPCLTRHDPMPREARPHASRGTTPCPTRHDPRPHEARGCGEVRERKDPGDDKRDASVGGREGLHPAATLIALGDGDLRDIALTLGSDVPFFLEEGTAYATGRGEVLTPLPPASRVRSRASIGALFVAEILR